MRLLRTPSIVCSLHLKSLTLAGANSKQSIPNWYWIHDSAVISCQHECTDVMTEKTSVKLKKQKVETFTHDATTQNAMRHPKFRGTLAVSRNGNDKTKLLTQNTSQPPTLAH
jgi:hypothetical protein